MKRKIGDEVLIKSLEWYNTHKRQKLEGADYAVNLNDVWFNSLMAKYCGKTAFVRGIVRDRYVLNIDNGDWRWTDDMFEESSCKELIDLRNENEKLKNLLNDAKNNETLQKDLNKINLKTVDELETMYHKLKSDYNNLKTHYISLKDDYNDLYMRYKMILWYRW